MELAAAFELSKASPLLSPCVNMPRRSRSPGRRRSRSPRRSRSSRAQSPSWPPIPDTPVSGDTFEPRDIEPQENWKELSDGGYAVVYQARWLGIKVAIKQTSSKKLTSSPSLYREIRYLRQAGPHPNIIQLYGAFKEGKRVCLLLELHKHTLRDVKVVRNEEGVMHS